MQSPAAVVIAVAIAAAVLDGAAACIVDEAAAVEVVGMYLWDFFLELGSGAPAPADELLSLMTFILKDDKIVTPAPLSTRPLTPCNCSLKLVVGFANHGFKGDLPEVVSAEQSVLNCRTSRLLGTKLYRRMCTTG